MLSPFFKECDCRSVPSVIFPLLPVDIRMSSCGSERPEIETGASRAWCVRTVTTVPRCARDSNRFQWRTGGSPGVAQRSRKISPPFHVREPNRNTIASIIWSVTITFASAKISYSTQSNLSCSHEANISYKKDNALSHCPFYISLEHLCSMRSHQSRSISFN